MKKMSIAILTIAILMTGFTSVPVSAQDSYAMKVTADGTTAYYNNFEDGWTQAVALAESKETVVILGRDWLAGDTNNNGIIDSGETTGSFLYYRDNVEYGTENGSLLVKGNLNLTIDINGHIIDRGLFRADKMIDNGQVLTVTDGAMLTINDSGTYEYAAITGGGNSGNGGAVCVTNRATFILNSGRISGNKAKTGGGVYVSDASFYMNGGSVDTNAAEFGGGIALGKNNGADREFIVCKGGRIYRNYAKKIGAGVYIYSGRDDAVVTFENTEISANDADVSGGGVYAMFDNKNCEVNFGSGTVIRQNTASEEGGGVYVSNGSLRFVNARVESNCAFVRCAGVGVDDNLDDNSHGTLVEYGKLIFGGNTYIQENYIPASYYTPQKNSNLHIGDETCDIYQDINNPLTQGSSIGIDMYDDFSTETKEEKLSDAEGDFSVDSYKYFTSDNTDYIITARDNGSDGANRYQIYMEMAEAAKDLNIKNATLKSTYKSDTPASVDEKNKILTLTVNPAMKSCLENSTLYNVAEISYGDDAVGISDGDKQKNLLDAKWQVKAENNNYELWQINFVPYSGEWSDVDGSAARVIVDGTTKYYADFESAWIDALDASTKKETLLVFNKDWYAGDSDADGIIDDSETKGYFKVDKNGLEKGSNNGRLYLNDNICLTIDLNGHTISRNLDNAVEDGQVFSMQDSDIVLTIKDSVGGGKITGGNNKGNGGAFYVYRGNINFESGEITGNKAKNGAGIYWNSGNKLCVYGGMITQNTATDNGGGVYVKTGGKIYLGGDVKITDNSKGNLYLSEKAANIHNAAGQDGAVNKPLTNGAKIGITAKYNEDTISGDNSMFNEGDFRVMYSDNSSYFIRSVYNENGENHSHKLYINSWSHTDARIPRVKTVSVKDSNLIEDALIDYNTQTITLKAYSAEKSSFESIALDSLIECTYIDEYTHTDVNYFLYGANSKRDLRTSQEYKIMSDNGTYVMCTVKIDWLCEQHKDSDANYICDYCEKYISTFFTISGYNFQTNEATVLAPKSGKYVIVFADYESDRLEHVDVVEYDFTEGINKVSQENKSFALGSDDKVMLWYDMVDLVPVCGELTVN